MSLSKHLISYKYGRGLLDWEEGWAGTQTRHKVLLQINYNWIFAVAYWRKSQNVNVIVKLLKTKTVAVGYMYFSVHLISGNTVVFTLITATAPCLSWSIQEGNSCNRGEM